MTTDTGLAIREMADSDESAVIDLLTASLAGGPQGQRSARAFRWKHRDNPFGSSAGLVAERDGQLIGVRLAMRWQFALDGQVVRAVRMVDTATHPSARGLGVFTKLTLDILDRYEDEIDLVFNTPNAASRPGYLKMGWSPVGTVPISIRPVHPIRLAQGARAARAAGSNHRPPSITCPHPPAAAVLADPRFADLLASSSDATAPGRLATIRSLDYLRWRYGVDSGLDYRAVSLADAGRLRGVAIGRPRARGTLREFTLAEVLHAPGDQTARRRLLSLAVDPGSDHVAAHLDRSLGGRVGWRSGYFSNSRVGMGLVANPRRSLSVDPLTLSSWSLSLGDLEVF